MTQPETSKVGWFVVCWLLLLSAGAYGAGVYGAGAAVLETTETTETNETNETTDADAERDQALAQLFHEYVSRPSPGCAAGLSRRGSLEWSQGFGLASLEHGAALDANSVFRIASTSKQFTAAVILLLEQQEVLSLDDDVRKHLPELHDYRSAYGGPVTLRHLIHHTSGYRDYLTLQSLAGRDDRDWYDEEELVELLARQRELNFAPGSDMLYSNSGYFLLSQVALRATGKSLRELAQELIFGPLGMTASHFHDDANELVPGRAHGYAPEGDSFRVSQTQLDNVGDGGVFTSVADLAKWDGNFYQPRVGGERLLESLHRRAVVQTSAGEQETLDYASGLIHGDYRGLRTVSHGGGFVGYRAQLLRFPDQSLAFIVLCNNASANPDRLAKGIADVVLAEVLEPVPGPAPEPDDTESATEAEAEAAQTGAAGSAGAPELDRYSGTYVSPELDVSYRLFRGDEGLSYQVGRRDAEALEWLGNETWKAGGLSFRFRSEGGVVSGFALDAGRVQNLRFERVAALDPSGPD